MNVVRVKVVVGDVVVGSSVRKCVGVEWCACAVVSGGIGGVRGRWSEVGRMEDEVMKLSVSSVVEVG